MIHYVWLIPMFPLIGVLINGLFGRNYIKDKAGHVAAGAVGLSFLVSASIFCEVVFSHARLNAVYYDWIFAGNLKISAGFLVDQLSAIMLMVVTGVGFLVHIYSVGYMHGEEGYYRYFAYLNLFMVSMLILVLGNNYLLMFVGWEGVGLCSYLLIGFYFHKKSASDAGKKAFIVNRIGDAGFLLGMFLIYKFIGTLEYDSVFSNSHVLTTGLATAITLCLFVGACGKSAQIPLYVWLPDAMEGPTPVSALIHAATMVTAGVYMVCRSSALYVMAPATMEIVAVIGGLTAFFAASIGLVQNDIKRVLAYSTVSQLGYMFLGCGVGAFAPAIFHLMTHAFFKGLLFLGSGSVIHAMSGEQDMRHMGDLKRHIPITFATMLVGTIAIAGIPPFAGFWSKDEILAETFKSGHYFLWVLGVVSALMTSFYMFRLIFMTFYGKSRVSHDAMHHLHESPKLMTIPLMILAGLSVLGGIIPGFPPEGGWIHTYLAPAIAKAAHGEAHEVHHAFHLISKEGLLMLISVMVGIGGWYLAKHLYLVKPDIPKQLASKYKGVYDLLLNKYWVDEIYDSFIVNPCKKLTKILWDFDASIIDGVVNGVSKLILIKSNGSYLFDKYIVDGLVNGVASVCEIGSKFIRVFQTGFVQNYALAMLLGVFMIVSLYMFL